MEEVIYFEQIYQSSLQILFFNREHSILKKQWTAKSTNISFDELKFESQQWALLFEKLRPTFMLTDNRIANQILQPEYQLWLVHFLFPRVIIWGVKKWAIVQGDDIFAQVGAEQLVHESQRSFPESDFSQRFFFDEVQAINWFLGKENNVLKEYLSLLKRN